MASATSSGVLFGSISTQTSGTLFEATSDKLIFTKVHKDAIIPKKATAGSVGYDLYSFGGLFSFTEMHLLVISGVFYF